MYILYNNFYKKSIGRILRACCRSHVPIYVIRFCKAAGYFNAARPLLYSFLLDLILLYQNLKHKSICLAEFETDKFSCEVNFALLDSFYLCYWTNFFREERRKNFVGSRSSLQQCCGHMGKLMRRAGRPMGKKIFEGPTFYRRGGHMRPGPGCQTKGVAYGGCIRWRGPEGSQSCAGCTKRVRFREKRLCSLTMRFYLTFFERCGIMRIPAAPAAQGRV